MVTYTVWMNVNKKPHQIYDTLLLNTNAIRNPCIFFIFNHLSEKCVYFDSVRRMMKRIKYRTFYGNLWISMKFGTGWKLIDWLLDYIANEVHLLCMHTMQYNAMQYNTLYNCLQFLSSINHLCTLILSPLRHIGEWLRFCCAIQLHTITQQLDDRLILTNFSLWFNFYCAPLFCDAHLHTIQKNSDGKGSESNLKGSTKAWNEKTKSEIKCPEHIAIGRINSITAYGYDLWHWLTFSLQYAFR